jgi:hypothetical protein
LPPLTSGSGKFVVKLGPLSQLNICPRIVITVILQGEELAYDRIHGGTFIVSVRPGNPVKRHFVIRQWPARCVVVDQKQEIRTILNDRQVSGFAPVVTGVKREPGVIHSKAPPLIGAVWYG